ncbi:hypothetical protein DLM_2759 [Aquitalea magnusonii]|uniref:Uncharacterized protein n=1 Tax=Aquitalea magnusonii TaxID=332411 RepID=A0A3G9GER3_9NEIS|nr:hypothetical protein DLM_2759 [Aquitalea magnusonii]
MSGHGLAGDLPHIKKNPAQGRVKKVITPWSRVKPDRLR